MCLKDPQLKYLGQKAFSSYVRSLHIQKDRDVFKLNNYPLEEFAESLGLPGAPRIKFLKADADEVKRRKNAPRMEMALSGSEEDEEEDGKHDSKVSGKNAVRTKYDRMFERQNQDIFADHYTRMIRDDDKDDAKLNRLEDDQAADDDFFPIARRLPAVELSHSEGEDSVHETNANGAESVHIPGMQDPLVLNSRRREKLLKSKKKLLKLKGKGSKLLFDDEGNARQMYELENEDDFNARGPASDQQRRFVETQQPRLREADLADKQLAKEKRKAKREKQKERERAEADGEVKGVELGGGEDAMANFIADAQDMSEEEEQPAQKKQKWFQRDVAPRQVEEREIETLDDLEAEAARLLG